MGSVGMDRKVGVKVSGAPRCVAIRSADSIHLGKKGYKGSPYLSH